ncbi:chitosanase [Dactylosporangium sp. NPDC005555]|uniref:chitosanase n=1 Tax=Dactylosporangium sp. NPDC005555 TaxID=3154889 RepID=UPI0033B70A73
MATHDRAAGARRAKLIVSACVVVAVVAVTAVLVARARQTGLRLSTDQRTIIDRLESVLLHDSVVPQYARVVNDFDQRGFIAGIGDFSTAGGEALEVIHRYTTRSGDNDLSRTYGTVLATLAGKHSDDVSGLATFAQAWQSASGDAGFRRAQHDVLQERYFAPALDQARELGVSTPLGLAVIYDSLIQHGSGAGPDGLPELLRQADAKAAGSLAKVGERTWLEAFLNVRRSMLADPAVPAHQQIWPYEVGRVDALAALLDGHHDQLEPPLTVAPYGTRKLIDLNPFDLVPSLALPLAPGPGQTSARPGQTSTRPGGPGPSVPAGGPPATGGPPAGNPGGNPGTRRQGTVIGPEGLCLDVDGGVAKGGNHMKAWTCNGTQAQQWAAEPDGTLRAVTFCAQPRGDLLSPSIPVEIDPCDGRGSQQWRFTGGRLVNTASGLCLGVPADEPALNAFVLLMNCNGGTNQRWAPPGSG